jgi:hypothetical protein
MKRSTYKLVIITAIPIILLLAFVLAFVWSGSHIYRYKTFKTNLAGSFAYAQDNNCLRAEQNGAAVRISRENADRIYKELVEGGFIVSDQDLPVDDGILLDFGQGDQLRVWPAEPSGIFIYYVTPGGEEFTVLTGEKSRFATLELLVRVQGAASPNEPWSE